MVSRRGLRNPGEDLDVVLEIGARELLRDGRHVDALTLADGDPGIKMTMLSSARPARLREWFASGDETQ